MQQRPIGLSGARADAGPRRTGPAASSPIPATQRCWRHTNSAKPDDRRPA